MGALDAEIRDRARLDQPAAPYLDPGLATLPVGTARNIRVQLRTVAGREPLVGDLLAPDAPARLRALLAPYVFAAFRPRWRGAVERWMAACGLLPALVPSYARLVAALYPRRAPAPRQARQEPPLAAAFRRHLDASGVSPAPALRIVNGFLGWCRARGVEPRDLTPADVAAWRTHLRARVAAGTLRAVTAHTKVTAVLRLFRFSAPRGLLPPHLLGALAPLPAETGIHDRTILPEQFGALLAAAARERNDALTLCALLVTAAATAARLGELLGCLGEHAVRTGDGWTLSLWCHKERERRRLRLSPAAGTWLDLYAEVLPPRHGAPFFRRADGRPLSAGSLGQFFRRWADAAGIPPAKGGWHCLRHTTLTALQLAGASHDTLRAIAGHASRGSLRYYLHLSEQELAGYLDGALSALEEGGDG